MSNSTLDNLVKNGLPRWIYTWKTVAAIFFGGPIIVLLAGSAMSMVSAMLDPRDPNWAPSCHLTNRDPIVPGSRKFDRSTHDASRAEQERRDAIAKFRKAAAGCQSDNCLSRERSEFRTAANGYIRERATTAEQMLARYGEQGLQFARFVYGEDTDREIVDQLRQRYGAGHFDIPRGTSESAARMLLFKPSSEFVPCRAG
jgi:hypothetical protein